MVTHKLKLSAARLVLLCCYAMLWAAQTVHAETTGRIVKWKDEKGATHYGDKIPPQYANRESSVINRQGITVKQNKPISYEQQAADQTKLEQIKKDKALLGAFTSADEIDLARDRNIQPDLIALEMLNQEKNNHLKQLTKNKNLADSYTKRKKSIPQDLSAEIATGNAEIVKVDQRINERNQQIENTRKRFDADKKRYLALKNQTANEPAQPIASGLPENLPPTTAGRPSR